MLREKTAIKRLHELAEGWPKDLWIFSAGSCLYVMRCGKNGEHVMTSRGSVDIDSDGGDW